MDQIAQWTVYEGALRSDRQYENPCADIEAVVTFTSPTGKEHRVDAFWDGDQTWRVRFRPDEAGEWRDAGAISSRGETLMTPDSQDWVLDIRSA
jgi:hypothetical protein